MSISSTKPACRQPERPEAFWHLMLGVSSVDAGQVDVFPTERRYVSKQHVGNVSPCFSQVYDRTVEIERIPMHDRADDKIEAGGSLGRGVLQTMPVTNRLRFDYERSP